MKLLGSFNSPYVRKVRVVLAELGIEDQVTMEAMDPSAMLPHLLAANPLSKVPTLVLEDGRVIFDSPVICEFLDAEFGGNKLLPLSGPARFHVLTTEALGDGILDAGQAGRNEGLRREGERSPGNIERQFGKVRRGLQFLERDDNWRRSPTPDLGQITVGCAIGWLNFRLPDFLAEIAGPNVMAWFEDFSARPAMYATRPGQV